MKRILVRAPNWIGDQIMAYAFFAQLRKSYPDAWIGVVCTEWVKDVQFRGFIDEIFVLPRFKKKSVFGSYQSIRRIAKVLKSKGPWDLGLLLPNSFGSAYLFHRAGVRVIRGYQTDLRGFFLTEKLVWNPDSSIHRSDAYLRILAKEGLEFEFARDYLKRFDPVKHWPEVIPLEPPKEPYVVIAPGATADSRRWSTKNFASLIRQIHHHWGFKAVIVGGPAERPIVEEFHRLDLPVIDLVAQGSVSALWQLFQGAQFVVTNESGLAHVASICGAKVQIVCGAADPTRTKPIGPGLVQVLTNPHVSCWPCEKNVCQFSDRRKNQCHEGISSDAVMDGLERVLRV
jgi:lipopolysaccharide heptosyltransferase II